MPEQYVNVKKIHAQIMDAFETALEVIETENAVEVVRCKDCKYYEIHKPSVLENCEMDGIEWKNLKNGSVRASRMSGRKSKLNINISARNLLL